MTITELHIQLDLQSENRIDILKNVAKKCNEGYLFVDSLNGHCYLFDKNGNEDDVKKLKRINNDLFYNSDIKSIIISDSVENIGNDAFYNCQSLESIIISDSVKNIGSDSVKSIGNYAFWNCESLKSIVIPNSVKNIGYEAFAWCESLKSLTFKGKTINQVKAMKNYSFGIDDESIIKCI